MDLIIGDMYAADLQAGFLETLNSLADLGVTPQEALTIFQNRLRAGHRTYVARIEQRVVGTATLLVEKKFIQRGGLVAHIEDLAVHKDHQRKGIGTALVKHLLEEAKQVGCCRMVLDCCEELVPFFARLGCRPHDIGLRIDL
jgi:glucosamine-phosphate N-acetyltransferase